MARVDIYRGPDYSGVTNLETFGAEVQSDILQLEADINNGACGPVGCEAHQLASDDLSSLELTYNHLLAIRNPRA